MKFGMGEEGFCFVREDSVRGSQAACLVGGPSQIWGRQPSACTAPLGPHTGGLRSVFCPAHVRAKNGFYLISPPAGGETLRGLPSRARGVERRRWGEPYGAGPEGLFRRMGRCGETARCALPGESMERKGLPLRLPVDPRGRHRLTREDGRERLYPLSPKGLRLTCPSVGVTRWWWASAEASPQGEGFGRSTQKSSLKKSPKRKSPNQGTYMGSIQTHCRFAASLPQKMERAPASGFIRSGSRAKPWDSLRPGFLLEKAWIPAPDRGGKPRCGF